MRWGQPISKVQCTPAVIDTRPWRISGASEFADEGRRHTELEWRRWTGRPPPRGQTPRRRSTRRPDRWVRRNQFALPSWFLPAVYFLQCIYYSLPSGNDVSIYVVLSRVFFECEVKWKIFNTRTVILLFMSGTDVFVFNTLSVNYW